MEPQNNEVATTNQHRSPPEMALKSIHSNPKPNSKFGILVVFYACL